MSRYILDACALVALLRNEPGADKVAAVINAANNGEAEIVMHKVNLLEVFYDLYRSLGKEKAELVLSEVKKRPLTINAEITDEIFTEAGRLKASYKISLADSIALAQALIVSGELLTSDHHEFDAVVGREDIVFQWIR
ncbi:MAG: type II toxin-antitoxin system VapC family toxin [Oscillospiraceae bacterium]|jgi:predicted nucleic acid-binding protein|nr:type II toxin-antitoxin system VapC family toxin [Oscillospiraceae bacterium]